MLENLHREHRGRSSDHQFDGHGVGRDVHPAHEVVRFRSLVSLGFPTAAISVVKSPSPESLFDPEPAPTEMIVSFLGLIGPIGALPRHYTETMLERIREKDFSLRDFLDLFNHRLISLFYRAWEKYCLPVTYERSRLDHPAGEPDPMMLAL